MTIAMTLTLMGSILVVSGLAEAVLDEMHLSHGAALILLGVLFAGALVPMAVFGSVRLDLGGLLAPLMVGVYLLLGLDTLRGMGWTVLSGLLLGSVMFLFVRIAPGALEGVIAARDVFVGLTAGVLAAAILREVRAACACGMLAATVFDLLSGIADRIYGESGMLLLGHTGLMDAVVTAALVAACTAWLLRAAVLLCERRGVRGRT